MSAFFLWLAINCIIFLNNMDIYKYFNSMYVWTITLLAFVAFLASVTFKVFPTNLLISVFLCIAIDIAIKKFYLKKELRFPFSAVITGMIIGSIASLGAPMFSVVLACLIALTSKHFIRLKGNHIFNPATLGLLIPLALFGLGDEWWVAGFGILGFTIPITLLFVLANYKADKIKISIPAILLTGVLYFIVGYIKITSFTVAGILSAIAVIPFFFIFIMLSEPKTSPYGTKQQILFGIGVMLFEVILEISSVRYSFFIALLAGNLAYAIYRNYYSGTRNNR